ncbi:hypothetical protein B0H11DRAFT_1936826 [Mycena galericulata]|nr:hypothetical protein B0H11DRAFT_1936826 [Mycena galericulata]
MYPPATAGYIALWLQPLVKSSHIRAQTSSSRGVGYCKRGPDSEAFGGWSAHIHTQTGAFLSYRVAPLPDRCEKACTCGRYRNACGYNLLVYAERGENLISSISAQLRWTGNSTLIRGWVETGYSKSIAQAGLCPVSGEYVGVTDGQAPWETPAKDCPAIFWSSVLKSHSFGSRVAWDSRLNIDCVARWGGFSETVLSPFAAGVERGGLKKPSGAQGLYIWGVKSQYSNNEIKIFALEEATFPDNTCQEFPGASMQTLILRKREVVECIRTELVGVEATRIALSRAIRRLHVAAIYARLLVVPGSRLVELGPVRFFSVLKGRQHTVAGRSVAKRNVEAGRRAVREDATGNTTISPVSSTSGGALGGTASFVMLGEFIATDLCRTARSAFI